MLINGKSYRTKFPMRNMIHEEKPQKILSGVLAAFLEANPGMKVGQEMPMPVAIVNKNGEMVDDFGDDTKTIESMSFKFSFNLADNKYSLRDKDGNTPSYIHPYDLYSTWGCFLDIGDDVEVEYDSFDLIDTNGRPTVITATIPVTEEIHELFLADGFVFRFGVSYE